MNHVNWKIISDKGLTSSMCSLMSLVSQKKLQNKEGIYFGYTRDFKEHIVEVKHLVTNYFPVYMVHELIAPY